MPEPVGEIGCVRERLVRQAEDDPDFYDMERDAFIAGGNFVLDALGLEKVGDIAPLLDDVACLRIGMLRVCSAGHRLGGGRVAEATTCLVTGCEAPVYPGWLVEAEPEPDGSLLRDVPAILSAVEAALTGSSRREND